MHLYTAFQRTTGFACIFLLCLLPGTLLSQNSTTTPAPGPVVTPQRQAYPDMYLQPQDAALMDNIQPMPFSALDRLHLYEPIMYYSTDSLARKDLPYYGLELNGSLYELNPELVRPRLGHSAVDMYGLLSISVKAIKELKDKHEALAAKVGGYEARFTSIETQVEDLRKYLKTLYPYTEKTNMAFDKVVALEAQLKELRAEIDALKKP